MTVSRFWRETGERYNLRGMKCENCDRAYMPARSLCPTCRHASVGKLKPQTFSGNGVVESFTVVHAAPAGFEMQSPYVLAIIRLDEGPRVTAQVVDAAPADVKIGTRVRKCFRKISEEGESGIVHYGYKFVIQSERPIPSAPPGR